MVVSKDSSAFANTCTCKCKIDDSLQALMKEIISLRHIVNEVLEEVKKLNIISNQKAINRNPISLFVEFEHFPIDSDEKMNLLESYLEDALKFKAAVIEISKIEKGTTYDFVKQNLSSMLTKTYASEYSWFGANINKKTFGTLKLAALILEAADLHGVAENKKSTEAAIKSWLVRAISHPAEAGYS